jgi:hypothetical protein
MPTAVQPHTTPTRRSAIGFSLAAFAAGLAVPKLASAAPVSLPTDTSPIAALNQRLASLVQQRNEMECALLRMDEGPEYDALDLAFGDNFDQCLDIQDQIVLLSAQGLEDVAVQAAIAYYRAAMVDSAYQDPDDAEELGKDLRMLLASIFLAITKAADLDANQIGWGDMPRLCALWPAGGRQA